MNPKFKYPKTLHLPWSPGLQNDDRVVESIAPWVGKKIVVTEKLDGENTTMGPDYIHARSLDSKHHPSRNWVKALHATILADIPEGWRICGENMYAKHSIYYDQLPSYFLVFSIWDSQNQCLSWKDTKEWSLMLGLETVPELYVGEWDETILETLYTGESKCGGIQEGYVVRTFDGFPYEEFQTHITKYVRANHVQTDELWMLKPVEPNKLR